MEKILKDIDLDLIKKVIKINEEYNNNIIFLYVLKTYI